MSNVILFSKAEKLFNIGNYKQSFDVFKSIVEDSEVSKEIKSESYNMMGAIISFDPSVYPQDESGIEFYVKAVESDASNTDALLNIISTFGSAISSHKDVYHFDLAVELLNKMEYEFSKEEIELLHAKIAEREVVLSTR